jgi:hypothetical protein
MNACKLALWPLRAATNTDLGLTNGTEQKLGGGA